MRARDGGRLVGNDPAASLPGGNFPHGPFATVWTIGPTTIGY